MRHPWERSSYLLLIPIIVANFALRRREPNRMSRPHFRRDARVTEWAGLEIRKAACPLRGFESLSLR